MSDIQNKRKEKVELFFHSTGLNKNQHPNSPHKRSKGKLSERHPQRRHLTTASEWPFTCCREKTPSTAAVPPSCTTAGDRQPMLRRGGEGA